MRTSDLLLGGAVLFILFEVFRLKAVGNLIFFPGNVSSVGFTGISPTIDFTLVAENTSSVPIEIDSLAGNLFSGNTLIGNISSFVPTMVPGNGQAAIPVHGVLAVIGLVNDIIQAFTNKSFTQSVEVRGYANVQGLQVPLTIQLSIGA